MHREISHAGRNLQPESRLSLYLLTAVLAVLIGADLWLWLSAGSDVVTLFGFRFSLALVPAILGGARILYGSLDSLFEGRIGADLAVAMACVAAILAREPLVAAEVVFVGMLGECLEHFTFERTQRAMRSHRRRLPAPLLAAARRPGGARPGWPNCRSATASWSSRAPACRPTAWSSRAVPRWTSSALTGEGLPAERGRATRCWPVRSTNSAPSPSKPAASPSTRSSARSSN